MHDGQNSVLDKRKESNRLRLVKTEKTFPGHIVFNTGFLVAFFYDLNY